MNTIREERSGTYYVGVKEEAEARPHGCCRLIVNFDTDPRLRDTLLGDVQRQIERLAAEAPSEQEVNEAMLYFKKLGAERRARSEKSTTYWLDRMRALYFDGVDPDRDNEAVFTAVTPEAVRKLTKEILSQGNRFTAVFTQE